MTERRDRQMYDRAMRNEARCEEQYQEGLRIANALEAVANGTRAKKEETTLVDLRTHYRDMSKGRPPRGGKNGA